jgi:hypothetical protein
MAAYPFQRARDAFLAEYALLDELAASLSDEQTLLASRCRGWAVCDVLCHLDLGMVEILVALASPTDRPADTDFAAYWRDCCAPGEPDLGHARWILLIIGLLHGLNILIMPVLGRLFFTLSQHLDTQAGPERSRMVD